MAGVAVTLPNKRLKLTARVDCGMNLFSARRSLSAISLGSGTALMIMSGRLLIMALCCGACAQGSRTPQLFAAPARPRTKPDTVVTLLAISPSDSVVAERGRYTIILSAQTAEQHLQAWLAKHPHLRSDSTLLQVIQSHVAKAGWVQLVARSDDAQQRQDFLLAALLEKGAAAVRQRGTPSLAEVLAVRPWGTCDMANGRRFLLPDSSEVLRTLDGWHMCPAA